MTNAYNENSPTFGKAASSSTLSAFFDSRSDAETAVLDLKGAGIPSDSIRFVPGAESDIGKSSTTKSQTGGFWHALENFFFDDDDRATYAEGLNRGGFLVSVSSLNESQYQTAHDILDNEGSINIDERADQWRAEGWDSNAALATSVYDRNTTQAASTARTDDTIVDGIREETIPVFEENLRVGKRDVRNGSVRVRAYTVETPVSENLSLRDEKVTIDRKSVDRPLTDADRAFQERTISAEEHHEEAVVSKDARVVEEIGIRKTAADRTETINDTVRKTEVEIDDDRSKARAGTGQGQSVRRD